MKLLTSCKICGGQKFKVLFKQKDKNLGVPGKFGVSVCKNCRVYFMNPFPEKKDTAKYYPTKSYYSLSTIDKDSLKTNLKIKIYKTFGKEGFDLKKLLLAPIYSFSRGVVFKKNAKLLDIGSGSGQFLYEIKQVGMQGYGVEPGKYDKASAKREGLTIQNTGSLKRYKPQYFDIVTLNHVIEHLDEPRTTLREIRRVLKKEGTLIIGLPNTNSWAAKLFGKNWYQLDMPRHLLNYSEKLLKDLLEEAGFKILKVRHNSRPSQFSVSLRYLLNIKKRGIFEKILDVIFIIPTWVTNIFRVSDQIEVYCINR